MPYSNDKNIHDYQQYNNINSSFQSNLYSSTSTMNNNNQNNNERNNVKIYYNYIQKNFYIKMI